MTIRPRTATSRLAALALFIAVAAAVGVGVAGPVAERYAMAFEEARGLRQVLAGQERLARQADRLRGELAETGTKGELQALLMPPASDGAAAARLQSRMEKTIEGAGARLSSVQALPPQPVGTLRRIGLRLLFSADTESVRGVLHALEYGRPVTVLDNVFIHARTDKAVGTVQPLTVRLDVFAFLPGEG